MRIKIKIKNGMNYPGPGDPSMVRDYKILNYDVHPELDFARLAEKNRELYTADSVEIYELLEGDEQGKFLAGATK